jgi:hypothetical protein
VKWAGIVDNISLVDVAAAMLDQVINGFEKEPLMNEDLMRIGKQSLSMSDK